MRKSEPLGPREKEKGNSNSGPYATKNDIDS